MTDPMADPRTNPYASPGPAIAAPQPMAPAPAAKAGRGMRIAGVLLIVNGCVTGIEHLVMAATPGSGSPIGSGIAPIVIDIAIGSSLVRNNARWRGWAIARAALGGLIFTAIHLGKQDYALAAVQLTVTASLLMLLVGEAGKARIAVACSLFGAYVLLELIGLLVGA